MKYVYRTFIVISILSLSILVALVYRIKPTHENKGINKLKNETVESAFEEDKKKDINVFETDKPLRILVLGVDKTATVNMSEEQNGMRSDTIMLFTIDHKNNKVQMFSIPRDSYIKIHGYAKNKINASFNEFVYPNGGLGLTVSTIEDFLDVKIDHYAIVDYKVVSGIVDAVGGIDINWEHKDYFYRDDWVVPPLEINLKHGINHLDGMGAVSYLRARKVYKDQDIGRISAQQGFLMLLFDKLKSPATFFKLPQLLDIVDEFLETDLNYGEISFLAKYGLSLNREDIIGEKLIGHGENVEIGNEIQNVYVVSIDEARKIINEFPQKLIEKQAEEQLQEDEINTEKADG
ncbi:LCP family protein [Peptoniphilus mikwangii]|uniref:LCP family protein n=1 Tax=Peptoniphilus mikwangii TaxID=1354300 RepID=UPI0004178EC8|nr:LCP family protein [Peptoniphilus mikwangii]